MDFQPEYHRDHWMTDDQWYCAKVAATLKSGFHHIYALRPCGKGIEFDELAEMATFDFDALTRAVLLAHEHCVRIGISTRKLVGGEKEYLPETMRDVDLYSACLCVTVHRRNPGGERLNDRHPEISDLIKSATDRTTP